MCSKECICCAIGSGCLAGHFDGDEYYSPAQAYLVIARIYFGAYPNYHKEGKKFLKDRYGIDYDKLSNEELKKYISKCKSQVPYQYKELENRVKK